MAKSGLERRQDKGVARRLVVFCLVFAVRAYQALLSPLLGGGKCRFYPSCSQYAADAVSRFGPLAGLWLSVKRLAKCGPWHEGGFDPVPEVCDFVFSGNGLERSAASERTSKG